MKIQTFSIVVGTRACNARCPFCVSRMTGFGVLPKSRGIDERNLRKAIAAARLGGTTTVLMTGKGEPTLYPEEVTRYLELLGDAFPFVELQTNALEIGRLCRDGHSKIKGLTEETLAGWYKLGLDTLAVSVVDVAPEPNQSVYHPDYPDLGATLSFLHGLGFSLRLCVMMQRGAVDSPERVAEVVDWCRERGVDQLTVRPIRRPAETTQSTTASEYVGEHGLTGSEVDAIEAWIESEGTQLMTLLHGARIFDVGGQNVCLADCLTVEAETDDIRTLIYYGDGRIAYDWQYPGAVLLGAHAAQSEETVPAGRYR